MVVVYVMDLLLKMDFIMICIQKEGMDKYNRCMDGQIDKWTDRQINGWTDRQINGWTDRQINGWIDR